MTDATKLKISQSRMGLPAWNKGTIGICKPNSGSFQAKQRPHNFKGKYKRADGYIDIYKPEHPFPHGHAKHPKYVFEHRLVMEDFLKRYLLPDEIVHHINGIRDDNRIENLKLCANNAEHRKEHRAKWENEKPCSLCKQIKSLTEFAYRLNNPHAKIRYRYYSSWCYSCAKHKKSIRKTS